MLKSINQSPSGQSTSHLKNKCMKYEVVSNTRIPKWADGHI